MYAIHCVEHNDVVQNLSAIFIIRDSHCQIAVAFERSSRPCKGHGPRGVDDCRGL